MDKMEMRMMNIYIYIYIYICWKWRGEKKEVDVGSPRRLGYHGCSEMVYVVFYIYFKLQIIAEVSQALGRAPKALCAVGFSKFNIFHSERRDERVFLIGISSQTFVDGIYYY